MSSPAAFSAAKATVNAEYEDIVAVGHGIAYLYGVVGVVLFVQIIPKILGADMAEERKKIVVANTGAVRKFNGTLIDVDTFGFMPFSLAAVLGIPYREGFIKNRYIGRSFIQPKQSERRDAVRIKLNAVASAVSGKRVVMVDDSIVRGTTSARIVGLLKSAGAKEVHVRISSPPFRFPCHFGTDIDSQENLIACKFADTAEIAKEIGADNLAYLSEEDAHDLTRCGVCDGCFTGDYPINVSGSGEKNKFEEKIHKSN